MQRHSQCCYQTSIKAPCSNNTRSARLAFRVRQLYCTYSSEKLLATARKRSLGQGNIFTPVCHFVHRRKEYLGRYPPGRYTPWAGTPLGQVHPLGRYTPLDRYTPRDQVPPWDQVHPPRYTPQDQVHPLAGTTPPEVHPWDQVHPPRTSYTSRDQVHPPAGTLLEQCMLGDTGNKRAARILLKCILVKFLFWK